MTVERKEELGGGGRKEESQSRVRAIKPGITNAYSDAYKQGAALRDIFEKDYK